MRKKRISTYSICEKCNDNISNFAFKKHYNNCNGINKNLRGKKTIYNHSSLNVKKKKNGNYICLECNKEYCKNGIATHYWRNHTEQGKKFSANIDALKLKAPWNKGLTKTSDDRINKYSEKISSSMKGKHKGKNISIENRKKSPMG